MKKLTVGAEKHAEELCAILEQAREQLWQEHGIRLIGERCSRGKYTFYTYRVSGTSEGIEDNCTEIAMAVISAGIAEFVTDVWERYELQKIVASDFYYYGADEVEYLADSAVKMLAGLLGQDGKPLRAQHIALSVQEQLLLGHELLIEGLLRFRMRSLQEDLHRVALQSIDEYLMDLEYQEFVKILRYFLDVQEPRLPLLHMVCLDENTTRLYNAEGKPIEPGDIADPVVEDMLMSTLISLAPEKLHIHAGGESLPPLAETVTKIFADKTVVCRGCPLCHTVHQWADLPAQKATDQ
ncbi:putative sporulation protein YtxC [Tumebacillus sp. BK434]|uniref:putative sporulation protein YtxC n=1 Tax=Tumebacillus sp. BK434 TaxID=2512169 RepID=UPI00104A6EAC|nr:putative sporulation protein YtxC [Tumebacillus sp. BK434]TCP53685.1 putative sporulation protein YtxC [Tumebacillus sp. BK434]